MKRKITSKKYLLAGLALLFMASCTREDFSVIPEQAGDEKNTVPVSVQVGLAQGQFQSGSGYEPMTKADGEVLGQIRNRYHYLVMKEIDGDLIVERSGYSHFNLDLEYRRDQNGDYYLNNNGEKVLKSVWELSELLNVTEGNNLPATPLELALTPGDYIMLIILNGEVSNRNTFVPGQIIRQDGEDTETPQFLTYKTLGSSWGRHGAELSLGMDIYADTLHFRVDKTTELQPSGSPLSLQAKATRRTGSFFVFLKYREDEESGRYNDAQQVAGCTITCQDGLFPRGLDVFGDPYYANESQNLQLTSFDIAYIFTNDYYQSDSRGAYKIPGSYWNHARWESGFYFTDPDRDIRYTLHDWTATSEQGGLHYQFDNSIDRVFRHNQYDAIGFVPIGTGWSIQVPSADGMSYSMESWHKMDVVRDSGGDPENIVTVYNPTFYWNELQLMELE